MRRLKLAYNHPPRVGILLNSLDLAGEISQQDTGAIQIGSRRENWPQQIAKVGPVRVQHIQFGLDGILWVGGQGIQKFNQLLPVLLASQRLLLKGKGILQRFFRNAHRVARIVLADQSPNVGYLCDNRSGRGIGSLILIKDERHLGEFGFCLPPLARTGFGLLRGVKNIAINEPPPSVTQISGHTDTSLRNPA
ncbi:hypothetical protein [Phaeobacter sp. 22II1-1F12B]|uniref:hypothetical protein n=1 Tax=Phaeobacter sp. 22II1-1F12B TaxID=1317111 RepID=UPI0011858FD5|nr:hypothetical protein [Phaeobacter sp. 22II1-1F12B]